MAFNQVVTSMVTTTWYWLQKATVLQLVHTQVNSHTHVKASTFCSPTTLNGVSLVLTKTHRSLTSCSCKKCRQACHHWLKPFLWSDQPTGETASSSLQTHGKKQPAVSKKVWCL